MKDDLKSGWVAPPRPEWVRRINEEGSCMDIRGVVPLDEDSLLSIAKASTGLSDFGDDDWVEPFKVLIQALDDEAELNLMGRLMTRSDLLMLLEARLRIEDTYQRHPEIGDEQINDPLFIIGQGRTGTSVLQSMLSADPRNGTITNWEAMFPCPPPEKASYNTDPRIDQADKLITQWHRVVPELISMHEFRGHLQTENPHVHCLSFRSPAWFSLLFGQVPSYMAYMATQDNSLSYVYEKRVLKLLQWKNPRHHWVLKSPYLLMQLREIIKVYPDAKFIWTHRDPVKAFASAVDLVGALFHIKTDHPFIGGSLAMFTDVAPNAAMMNLGVDLLENGTIRKEQMCNIQYVDFVADPVACIEQIYRQFNFVMTTDARAAMQKFMADNPRSSRPKHEYDVGSNEAINTGRALFKRYQDYFSVSNE